MVWDPDKKRPSVTLLAFYMSMLVANASVIAMHFFSGTWDATIASLTLFVLSFVFYKLRRLTTAKLDLDDKSLELSDDSGSSKKKVKSEKSDSEPS